ncbi:hypothetical protein [Streptomyces sp. WMMC905]
MADEMVRAAKRFNNPATLLFGIGALVPTWFVIAHHKKGNHS